MVLDSAIHEIDLNAQSARFWLKSMEGYELKDDLTCIEEDYGNIEEYRRIYNHVRIHLHALEFIPNEVKKGTFKPKLGIYY